MKISLKTPEEIAKMRAAGEIAGRILNELKKTAKVGMTTKELDEIALKKILETGSKPSFLGFSGYPGAICISVNDEVVHGIPGKRVLREGDIVGLDIGVFKNGYHADTAITFGLGKITPEAEKLLLVTCEALQEGLNECQAGKYLGDVQNKIQTVIEKANFGIVKDLTGHGIGQNLQEPPSIPNYGHPGSGPKLEVGMTLAIEPMVTLGDWHVQTLKDNWTIVTRDHSLSAHFEHTVAITANGPQILTEV